jgi:hypothetical protein
MNEKMLGDLGMRVLNECVMHFIHNMHIAWGTQIPLFDHPSEGFYALATGSLTHGKPDPASLELIRQEAPWLYDRDDLVISQDISPDLASELPASEVVWLNLRNVIVNILSIEWQTYGSAQQDIIFTIHPESVELKTQMDSRLRNYKPYE